MMARLRAVFLAGTLASGLGGVGCSLDAGGQTGDEGETRGCRENGRSIDLAEVTPLGFSAADVLSYVEGSRTSSFEWEPPVLVPYGPEQGTSEVQLEVRSLKRARFVTRSMDVSRLPPLEGDPSCPDAVQVDVRMSLRTSGGALKESFDAVVEATRADFAHGTVLLNPPFEGALAFDEAALGTAHIADLQLDVRFTPAVHGGRLTARIQDMTVSDEGAAVSLRTEPLMSWGVTSHSPLSGE